MAAELTLPEPESRVLWRGIHFSPKRPERDELRRWEAHPGDYFGACLWVWKSGQWGARFPGGNYAIGNSMEEALVEAACQAIGMLRYDISRLSNLLMRG